LGAGDNGDLATTGGMDDHHWAEAFGFYGWRRGSPEGLTSMPAHICTPLSLATGGDWGHGTRDLGTQ